MLVLEDGAQWAAHSFNDNPAGNPIPLLIVKFAWFFAISLVSFSINKVNYFNFK